MRRIVKSILAATLLAAAAASSASAQENYQPSPEIVAAQEQFRENRFGIFIHWGIYSMYGQGEWALNYNGLTHEEYSKQVQSTSASRPGTTTDSRCSTANALTTTSWTRLR